MSSRDWFGSFLHEATYHPSLLVKTIARARPEEVGVTGAAVGFIADPKVRVIGYSALARRSPLRRGEFLVHAARSADLIEHVRPRIGALGALFDTLPERDAAHYYARIATLLDEYDPEELRAYVQRWKRRAARAGIELGAIKVFLTPPPPLVYVGARAGLLESAVARGRVPGDAGMGRIRAIEPAGIAGLPKVRLAEIATSVGIDPVSFDFSPSRSFIRPAKASRGERAVAETEKPRVVNTGFADSHGAPTPIVVSPGDLHHYFIEIGERLDGAFESQYELSDDITPGSTIDVVIFTNEDGLALEGPSTGKFTIQESGDVVVSERAATVEADKVLLDRRMFFAFRAPHRTGNCSMRCSFYCRGALLQSRHIKIPVGLGTPASVVADYVSSRNMSPKMLASSQPPKLSMMLNENGDGTHSFRFYGADGALSHSSTFGELELQSFIKNARQSLRFVSWGSLEEWEPDEPYEFSSAHTIETVLPHLLELARQGRVLWDAVIDKFSGGPIESVALREHMRPHGSVELALKEGASMVVPLALFYDHALDTSLKVADIKLCSTFVAALGGRMEDAPCFNGECPSSEKNDVVCPGGFWGFRHSIGLTVSLGADQKYPPEVGPYISSGKPSLVAGVSTDPDMGSVDIHLANVGLGASIEPEVFKTRDDTIKGMKTAGAPIVYFYCHGGKDRIEGPYLEVGPKGGPTIARNTLRGNEIFWSSVRPIVFMNGCRTTSVSPEEALDLVNGFVRVSGASGVVGTEITIFESLAAPFAERFFKEFIANRQPVGEAIRHARLRLLKDSLNPLGLAYIPFAHASLLLQSPLSEEAAEPVTA